MYSTAPTNRAMVFWLVEYLVDRRIGWSEGRVVGQLVCWLFDTVVGLLVSDIVGRWLIGGMVGKRDG